MNDMSFTNTYALPARFRIAVDSFTVVGNVSARGSNKNRMEFALTGRVNDTDPDFDDWQQSSSNDMVLAGRTINVTFCSRSKPAVKGDPLGWIQFMPGAPGIKAQARIECCPRRISGLRSTAHHASGPLGGQLELILCVAASGVEHGATVTRIPIEDAMIRATRRFAPVPIADESMDDMGASFPADAFEDVA